MSLHAQGGIDLADLGLVNRVRLALRHSVLTAQRAWAGAPPALRHPITTAQAWWAGFQAPAALRHPIATAQAWLAARRAPAGNSDHAQMAAPAPGDRVRNILRAIGTFFIGVYQGLAARWNAWRRPAQAEESDLLISPHHPAGFPTSKSLGRRFSEDSDDEGLTLLQRARRLLAAVTRTWRQTFARLPVIGRYFRPMATYSYFPLGDNDQEGSELKNLDTKNDKKNTTSNGTQPYFRYPVDQTGAPTAAPFSDEYGRTRGYTPAYASSETCAAPPSGVHNSTAADDYSPVYPGLD